MSVKKKILIGEDSNIVLSVIRKILENMQYEVKGVKNGQEILSELKKDSFDLILMDISMPKMDGLECVKHIRSNENEKIQSIPIIAISGNAKNFSLDQYKEHGFNDLIQKPIDFDILAKKIVDTFA